MAVKLTNEMKRLIVVELACMSTPSEIRDMVEKEFGVKLNLSTIVYYDPTSAGTKVADKWRTLFERTREKFITDCGRVPISHEAYRLRELQKLLDLEKERKNTVGARETLEQAAKEKGGAFTNKREISGSFTLEDIIREAAGKPAAGNANTDSAD